MMRKTLGIILAGGRVDELSVITLYRPKSAVPFAGMYRVIDFPMSNLMRSGINKVGILSQYRPASLINHIGAGASWDMLGTGRGARILPPYKGDKASDWYKGTADAVYQNLEFIREDRPERVLIISGDHIYNMDYSPMIEYHIEKGADVTAAFVKQDLVGKGPCKFGVGEIDNEDGDKGGRLIGYEEKPAEPKSDWASMTVFVFDTTYLISKLEENDRLGEGYEFGRNIFPRIIGKDRVYAYKFYGYWGYTRTIDDFYKTNMDTLGNPPKIDLEAWQVRTNMEHRRINERTPAKFLQGSDVEDALVSRGCCIQGEVKRSILSPGVIIEKGAVVRDSIIMHDCIIRQNAMIENCILDTDVEVGANSYLGAGEEI
ncbi:MAG: sugar phosphate nucleotidyltransferase, partial [Thermoplasmata archaeon]